MGIADYIEHLREKPEHVRNRYAFWTALGVTLVIAIFWVSSFSFTDFSSRHDSVAETVKKVGSPGASMIAGVGDFVGDIWSMIVGPKKVVFSEVQVTPGLK